MKKQHSVCTGGVQESVAGAVVPLLFAMMLPPHIYHVYHALCRQIYGLRVLLIMLF